MPTPVASYRPDWAAGCICSRLHASEAPCLKVPAYKEMMCTAAICLPHLSASLPFVCRCLGPALPQEHPVSEALFNFVNAWSLMLWPVMAADAASVRVPQRFRWWVSTMVCHGCYALQESHAGDMQALKPVHMGMAQRSGHPSKNCASMETWAVKVHVSSPSLVGCCAAVQLANDPACQGCCACNRSFLQKFQVASARPQGISLR